MSAQPLAASAPTDRRGLWVLVATIAGSSMAFIDNAAVNVALPVMQRELGADVAQMQWVVEGYTLFLSALLLVGGTLGDHFGRGRVFGIGIGLFALASMACGFAPTAGLLIAARAAQGVGAALLVPGSLSIISAHFDGAARGKAIGTWSAFSTVTSALGPILGGFLVEHASWRWVFFINVPLAAIVLFALLRVPDSHDPESARGLDWPGALLVTLGLGGLVFGLIESSSRGWGDGLVLFATIGGVLALIAFVLVERYSPHPMMPLNVFRVRTFGGANLLTLLLYGALGASGFFLPFTLIQLQGYAPTAAGAVLLPFVILVALLSRWSGGLLVRFGPRPPLVVGPAITGVGFALLAVPGIGGSYWTTYFPAAIALGLGMGITVAPLTTAVMSALDAQHTGLASGINNAVARTAGLLAIAALGIVVVNVFSSNLETRLASVELAPQARQQLVDQRERLAAAEIPADLPAAVQAQVRTAINESFLSAFRWVMLICTALAFASAIIALLTLPGRPAALSPALQE